MHTYKQHGNKQERNNNNNKESVHVAEVQQQGMIGLDNNQSQHHKLNTPTRIINNVIQSPDSSTGVQKTESQLGFSFLKSKILKSVYLVFRTICGKTAVSKQNCPIGCPQELQSTSKVHTHAPKVESQYITFQTNLIIMSK